MTAWPWRSAMRKFLGMCLDRRVLAGVGVVGLAIWLYAPQLVGAALPVLVVLICPLSMLVMAWTMRGSMGAPNSSLAPTERLAELERQQAQLNAAIAKTRAKLSPTLVGPAST